VVQFQGVSNENTPEHPKIVKMLEAGYETSMSPKALRDAVGVVLRNPGEKRCDKKSRIRIDGE